MNRFILLSVAILILGFVISWIVAGKLVAPARRTIVKPNNCVPYEDIAIESESGSMLSGWVATHPSSRGVIILLHGIRGSKSAMASRAPFLFAAGYTIILIDFQAHGESTGKNITVGHYEKLDVRATVKFVKTTQPNQPIGILGVSMGGAAAILGSPLSIQALIVESVYPSLRTAIHNRVARRLGKLSWLPAEILLAQLKPRLGISIHSLRPIDKINTVGCPLYVISGKQDTYTTESETISLFDAAMKPKELWLVENVAHEDIFEHNKDLYQDNILAFLATHMQ